MAKIHWKTKEEIEQEKQQREQERQKKQVRRQRIKEGVANANSVKALRELVNNMAVEMGLIDEDSDFYTQQRRERGVIFMPFFE